jgi:prepilin-type processing-associated H-X9-DG protein
MGGGYVSPTSVTTVAAAVAAKCIFHDPSGLNQPSSNPYQSGTAAVAYASSNDAQGYLNPSYTSGGQTYQIASWYGSNSVFNNPMPLPYPFINLQNDTTSTPPFSIFNGRKMTTMSHLTQVVGLFCGLGVHNANPGRFAARHDGRTTTNVWFLDGHCANVPNTTLQQAFSLVQKTGTSAIYNGVSFSIFIGTGANGSN